MNKHEIKDIENDIEEQLLKYDVATSFIRRGVDLKKSSRSLIEATNAINNLLDRLDANEIKLNTEELH